MSKIKLLMVDNYDSFTFNIVQYFGELGAEVEVFRNDEITLEGIAARKPDRLVISPGPCSPAEAGISVAAIQHFAGKLPILGVCLGHQSIGAAFGGKIIRAQELMHGKTSVITTTQEGVFGGLPAAWVRCAKIWVDCCCRRRIKCPAMSCIAMPVSP
jgi:anthranilate synthase component 2